MSTIRKNETIYNSLFRLFERQDAFDGEVAAVVLVIPVIESLLHLRIFHHPPG